MEKEPLVPDGMSCLILHLMSKSVLIKSIPILVVLLSSIGVLWKLHTTPKSVPLAEMPDERIQLGVIYSSWGGNKYLSEFDDMAARLGWEVTHMENKDVGKWIEHLSRFQIIVATTALVDNAPDMAPYREQWNRWIDAGGVLVVVDANYSQVLAKWLCTLGGEEVALNARGVNPHDTSANPTTLQCDTVTGILVFPNDVRFYLKGKWEGTWSRFFSWGKEWRSLVNVGSDGSLMLMREQGKGAVIATCYSAFDKEKDKPNAYRLFENILTRFTFKKEGLVVRGFEVGPADPGDHEMRCVLKGEDLPITPHAASEYRATLFSHRDGRLAESSQPTRGHLEGDELVFRIPYRVDQRGQLTLQCVVSKDDRRIGSLSQVQEIPLQMINLQPYNLHPNPGHPLISFGCRLSPDNGVRPADCTLRIAIDGVEVSERKAPAVTADFCIPCPGLENGKHSLTVSLHHRGKVLAETGFPFDQTERPMVYYRPDGVFVVREAPFFPLGWYHVSWATDANDRTKAMRTIGDAGYNFISASMRAEDFPGGWQAFLTDARDHGVMVLTETKLDWKTCIPALKDNPALFGYTAADEPDGGGTYPPQVTGLHESLKQSDHDHPTWATLSAEDSQEKYVGLVDIVAPDPYPYVTTSNEEFRDQLHVFRIVKKAAALAEARGTTCMAVLQCFGGYEVFTLPTFAQVRSMTYQALLAGAKGIVYYTFNDSDLVNNIHRFRMEDHPDLWEEMKRIPSEIQTLHPALFQGTRFNVETALPRSVYAGGWILPDKLIVCIGNDSNNNPQEVTIPLPVSTDGQPCPLFGGDPGNLTLKNQQLIGTLKPMETLVFEIPRK